jgi:hypothetical protein
MNRNFAAIAAALMLVGPILEKMAIAQPAARTEQVKFPKNTTSTVIKGQVKGDQFIDYRVSASAGQTLAVSLKPSNPQNYFNVLPPGSNDAGMFNGSIFGNNFKGLLPTDGDYTLRVYLMRPAARRNESSNYTLTIGVTGKPLAPVPAKTDALIPGTPFHASAKIRCTYYLDPKLRECEAFVIRRGFDGTATVEVRWPNFKRNILFVKGKPVASDSSEKLSTVRQGDLSIVSLGTAEQFDIPDVLVTGG